MIPLLGFAGANDSISGSFSMLFVDSVSSNLFLKSMSSCISTGAFALVSASLNCSFSIFSLFMISSFSVISCLCFLISSTFFLFSSLSLSISDLYFFVSFCWYLKLFLCLSFFQFQCVVLSV